MKRLLALLFTSSLAALAIAERRANQTPGKNATIPIQARDLFARQYTCPSGYGVCDAGQCCELNEGCCGSNNCAPEGWACCGYEGQVYPTDGSECCSDGGHCPPGDKCYECQDYPGEICCYGPGDFQTTLSYEAVPTLTYDISAAITSYSAAWSSYYAAYSSYSSNYDAAWSSYSDAYSSYTAGVGSYEYQYYYTTYFYYIIVWYTTTFAISEKITSSSSQQSTVLSAYCTDTYEAQSSFETMTSSIAQQVSYSNAATSLAPISTLPVATNSGSFAGANGVGSLGQVRHEALVIVLPVLGALTGALAVLL